VRLVGYLKKSITMGGNMTVKCDLLCHIFSPLKSKDNAVPVHPTNAMGSRSIAPSILMYAAPTAYKWAVSPPGSCP